MSGLQSRCNSIGKSRCFAQGASGSMLGTTMRDIGEIGEIGDIGEVVEIGEIAMTNRRERATGYGAVMVPIHYESLLINANQRFGRSHT